MASAASSALRSALTTGNNMVPTTLTHAPFSFQSCEVFSPSRGASSSLFSCKGELERRFRTRSISAKILASNRGPQPRFVKIFGSVFRRHVQDVPWLPHPQTCQFSRSLASDMADVHKLEQVGLAPVADPLLEDAEALNQISDDRKVLFCKHIVRKKDVLRT